MLDDEHPTTLRGVVRNRNTPRRNHMSHASAVVESAILVFREGLKTILVLAAATASFLGADRF
jgi:high-affinity Fe2+/Pb2+ permease